MVVHLVLYRPRPNLETSIRDAFLTAVASARDEIPQVRRFVVGKRLEAGPAYQLGSFPDLPFAALIEFADREGLEAYLSHPAHQALGRLFNGSVEAGLVYDYEVVDAAAVASLIDE